MLQLTLYGGFRLAGDDGVEIRLKSKKAKALLAYLALPPGKAHSREEIMALLWSDRGEAQARASLRQALTGLRKELGAEGMAAIRITDESVSLEPEHVLVEDGRSGDELLAGFHLHDPAFEEWLRDERLREDDKVTQSGSSPKPSLTDKPSIAVLPFTNMSSDPAQEHIADGIAEDIITALSKVSNIFVVARNSTFTYKGRAIDVKQVGRDQGVRYVMEGSVQRSGQRLRVAAQLIDAASGHHIWAQRYDRVIEDVFDVQDEITREVTSALQVQLTEGEQARLWASGTKNFEAWEAAIQCPKLLHSHRRVDVLPARRLAERALQLDQTYASAWGMLGWSYWNEAFNGWTDDPDATLERAQDAFNRALAIDDSNPDTLALLAFLHLSLRKYDEARQFIEKAMMLGPNNSFAFAVAANVELFCNRPHEMVPLLRRAMRLCPIYPAWYLGDLGFAYLLMGRLEEAIATATESIKIDPDYIYNYHVLAVAHSELGQARAARAAVENMLRIEPNMSIRTFHDSQPYEDEALRDRIITAFREAGLPE